MTRFVYVGSETRIEGGHRKEGITVYKMDPDSGKLSLVQKAESGETPSFMAMHPNGKFLYAINEGREGRATAFSVDSKSGELKLLNTAAVKGLGPCYISLAPGAKWALVANYGGGSVSVLPVQADGKLGDAVATVQHQGKGDDPKRQEGPHAHSIIPSPDGNFILAADLGTNKVYVYRLGENGELTPNMPPAFEAESGAGPRHMAFHPNGRVLYVANELSNSVVVYSWDPATGTLIRVMGFPTLPEEFQTYNIVADIHMTPDSKFLYVSNRGHDSLSAFSPDETGSNLLRVGWVSTGGKWPRNFSVDPDGKFILVANQESDSLVLFKINPSNGLPEPTGDVTTVDKPMFVTIVDL